MRVAAVGVHGDEVEVGRDLRDALLRALIRVNDRARPEQRARLLGRGGERRLPTVDVGTADLITWAR